MTVISIVIGALDTVTKGLVKGLEDLEIRGRVVRQNMNEGPGYLLSLRFQWKTIS